MLTGTSQLRWRRLDGLTHAACVSMVMCRLRFGLYKADRYGDPLWHISALVEMLRSMSPLPGCAGYLIRLRNDKFPRYDRKRGACLARSEYATCLPKSLTAFVTLNTSGGRS
jgi:hypothetical protein